MKRTMFFSLILVIVVIGAVVGFKFIGERGIGQQRVNSGESLVVGVDATFYPMEYLDEGGQVVGFGADLAKKIGEGIGSKVVLRNIGFDRIFGELDGGNIDMIISSITITVDRSKVMDFSKPYFNAGQILVENKENLIKDNAILKGKKLGVQTGTTSEKEAVRLVGDSGVVRYKDYDLATADLKIKKIDAVVIDYPAGVGLAKKNSDLVVVGDPFTDEYYGVVVKKGNKVLLGEVNRIIADMIKSGQMKEMENKWLR